MLQVPSGLSDSGFVPTNRDHPWLRDVKATRTSFDPTDPRAAAKLHVAKQRNVIDEARESTSVPPPKRLDGTSSF